MISGLKLSWEYRTVMLDYRHIRNTGQLLRPLQHATALLLRYAFQVMISAVPNRVF